MHIGTDLDGRNIEFDEASNSFTIGGISSTIDRLISYDRGGQVNWASADLRDWAYRYEAIRVEHVGQQQSAQAAAAAEHAARTADAARRAKLSAQGYDAASTLSLASQLRGLALLLIIGSSVTGAGLGFSAGVVAGDASAMFVASIVFGAVGLLWGYLASLGLKAVAHGLSAVVQIEMNTRRDA